MPHKESDGADHLERNSRPPVLEVEYLFKQIKCFGKKHSKREYVRGGLSKVRVWVGWGDGEEVVGTRKNLCGECKEAVAKYKCPVCSVRTCSLKCVNAHKARTQCSGVRDKTAYLPMDKLGDREMFSGNFSAETAQMDGLIPSDGSLYSLTQPSLTRLFFSVLVGCF